MMGLPRVTGFEYRNQHLNAWVELGNGTQAAFHFCPGDNDVLDGAVDDFNNAIGRVVEMTMMDCIPVVPDHAPDITLAGCRICDVVSAANVERGGRTYCVDHAPAAE